jgi:hypothetical protein
MARAKNTSNGKLDEAIQTLAHAQATLVQTQANLVAQMADWQRDFAEFRRRTDEWQRHADERFARIEAILLEHSRILQALPDAVREKIGFKAP